MSVQTERAHSPSDRLALAAVCSSLKLDAMEMANMTHTPWAQLPFEARFCFILFFSGIFGPEELDWPAVVRALARIWDAERLTLGFLQDDDWFWELYRKYQKKYREGVWRLEGYGISREEAERAGFAKARIDTPIAICVQ